MGWLNWIELEKHNDWGVRGKDDATAELWNKGAKMWEARSGASKEVAKKQVALLDISPEDSVLDLCCGTGPLTNLLAKRAKKVTAMDYGSDMLKYVMQHAEEENLLNIETFQCNWHHVTPGVDFPKHDIVVTRHSPAQGNILKLSQCATKYCYSISDCAAPVDERTAPKGRWIRSASDGNADPAQRPDARLYGLNIHFNILYDLGANPTINYAVHKYEKEADTKDEIIDEFYPMLPDDLKPMIEAKISQLENGRYYYYFKAVSAVLGWNPNELQL